MISARFYLSTLSLSGTRWSQAELAPVVRGEHNKAWSSATPGGKMKLSSLSDEEFDWFLTQRRERPGDGYGAEFDVWFGKGDPGSYASAAIFRKLRVASVARDAMVDTATKNIIYGNSGTVRLTTNDGPYTDVELTISNPAAYTPFREDFCGGDGNWWMALL